MTATGLHILNTEVYELRIELIKSIIEKGDLAIPEGIGLRGSDGRYYSWVGIGSALLSIPFYIVGKLTGIPEYAVLLVNQIFGAATAVLVFLFSIALGYSRRTSLGVSILYGLGTFAWPLAKQPFDHTIETFFILLSVYFIYRHVTGEKLLYLLLSGFSLGFAFITRQTSILVIPPLFILMIVYYLKRYNLKTTAKQTIRDIILFSLAFLPFIGLSLWYNYYRFGSIFETGYQLIAERTGIDFFTGTSLLTGLRGFLISPGKGFFYYSPVAILFFFGIKSFFKRHFELSLCFILIIFSYLFFLSKNLYWHGDWAWGPRYILAITPFLIIPIAELFQSRSWIRSISLRAFVYCVVALSFVIQVAAVSVAFEKYFINLWIVKKVKYIQVSGEGVQPITGLPTETYFDWHQSPIVAQFRFVYEIASKMNHCGFLASPVNATCVEEIKADPRVNVVDFWWVYEYYTHDKHSFLTASTFRFVFLLAIFLISRICRLFSKMPIWTQR